MSTTYVLDDLADYITNDPLPFQFGTNLFVGLLPDAPDQAVALFEYAGMAPDYVFGPNPLPAISNPHVQAVIRDVDYPSARADAEGVARTLEQICNQVVNTTYYERVARLQDPFFMKRDAVRYRVYFCVNFEVMRTPT